MTLFKIKSIPGIHTIIITWFLIETTKYVLNAEQWTNWNCEDLTLDECQLDVVEGSVQVRGLTVHYWKYSSSKSTIFNTEDLPLSPIIFIHGGPSSPHDYGLPLKKQACIGRDIVFYDQAGCGKSSIPDAPEDEHTFALKYGWLFDISYYATEELPTLISHLGWDKFHIIGHSWGSMVAQVFALDGPRKIVEGIQSLTLSGPISDIDLFVQAQWDPIDGSITKLPLYLQRRIHVLQNAKQYDSEEYSAIVDTYCSLFLVRTQPTPDCVINSFSEVNPYIYHALFGEDNFSAGGNIKDFNITSRIHKIEVPVLLTSGHYDNVRPQVVDTIQNELKNVERITFTKSAHLSMIDEPEIMNEVILDFLHRVEQSIVRNIRFISVKYESHFIDNTFPDKNSEDEIKLENIFNSTVLIVISGSTFIAFVLGFFIGARFYRKRRENNLRIPRTTGSLRGLSGDKKVT